MSNPSRPYHKRRGRLVRMVLLSMATIFFMQGQAMAATLMHVEVGGVKVPVIFEREQRLPLASMQLVFRDSGSLADTVPGIASLGARLLGEGTHKEGAVAFAAALENRAVSLSAHAGRETFVLTLESLKSEFDFGRRKLARLLSDPNYTPEAFEKVRTEAIGELTRRQGDFDYIAATQLRKILFKATPLEHPSLGTIESLRSLSLEQVKRFLTDHLHPENVIVVLGGRFEEKEIPEIVRQALAPLPHAKVAPIPHFEASAARKEKVKYEATDQAYIYFGAPYRMAADDPDNALGRVAAFILGSSGFGSRLMEEIRVKRGLAYSAYGRFIVNVTHSYFSGYLQTKIGSGDEAKKVVQDVVDRFVKEGATAKELEGAKKFFLGSEPLRTETLVQRMHRAFHEYYTGLGLGWSRKELERIRSLTLEELNRFIHAHPEIGAISYSIVTQKEK